jgi:hypothetical protein
MVAVPVRRPVQIVPAASARGNVAHQSLDLADGGGDLVDGRSREEILRVSGNPVEEARECGVDDGGEPLKSLAGGSTPGPVEPKPVLGELLAGLLPGLINQERGLADVEVVDIVLAEPIDVGEFVGDGPAVDRRQAGQ